MPVSTVARTAQFLLPILLLADIAALADIQPEAASVTNSVVHRAFVHGSKRQSEVLAQTGWISPILIGTHHKTGTVLLSKIFRIAAKFMGVPRFKEANPTNRSLCSPHFKAQDPMVCIVEHVSARDVREFTKRPTVPFIHAVREPLEMCISAYQYHLHGTEPWLRAPLRDLNGSSLQEYYAALSPDSAVRFECKRMMFELIETALVYNSSRARAKTMTVRLEEFSSDYDSVTRRLFNFLGTPPPHVEHLVNASIAYDLKRNPAGDEHHVSASVEKTALRAMVMLDPLVSHLMHDLRDIMGYGGISRNGPKREQLCDLLQEICATTHVGFMHWCSYGRVHPGRLPSLPECGDISLSPRLRKGKENQEKMTASVSVGKGATATPSKASSKNG